MTKSKKIFVGRYAMNRGTVVLHLDPGVSGGSGSHGWYEGSGYCADVSIGALDLEWPQLVRALLHELLELSALRERCHYHGSGTLLPVPVDSYLLVMDHPQFTRVVDEAGDALAYALPDMEKAWKKWKKEK